jgi:hypothetical protein
MLDTLREREGTETQQCICVVRVGPSVRPGKLLIVIGHMHVVAGLHDWGLQGFAGDLICTPANKTDEEASFQSYPLLLVIKDTKLQLTWPGLHTLALYADQQQHHTPRGSAPVTAACCRPQSETQVSVVIMCLRVLPVPAWSECH